MMTITYLKSRTSFSALALVAAATMITATAAGVEERQDVDHGRGDRNAYTIGLWGDLPYSDTQATTGVPNLIADMNASNLEFSVHDGDLKAGNGTPGSSTPTVCSDALYQQALGYFDSLQAPAMFTPGDNDWTD